MPREAFADLQASTKLLPTAIAYNSLGELEMSAGSTQRARQYFQEASGSDSQAGKEARMSLLRLDFPQNAGKYIQIQVELDKKGLMLAKVTNRAQLGINNLEILIDYPDALGKRHQTKRRLSGIIPAGKFYTMNLKLGPYKDASMLNKVRTRIINAKLVENKR